MRTHLLILLSLLVFNHTARAISDYSAPKNNECDIIILKDGSEINGKVLEINGNDITYNKCENLEGAIYHVEKSKVFMIRFSNGTKEVFKDDTVSQIKVEESEPIAEEEGQVMNPVAVGGFVASLFLPIIGFIISIIALKQINKNPKKYRGKGFATAGIAFGFLWIIALIGIGVTLLVY